MNPQSENQVPPQLEKSLEKRDKIELAVDAWVKYQAISLGPGISKNYRYLVMRDGRLFFAANRQEVPDDRTQVYNTPMPKEPSRVLQKNELDEIRTRLAETDFFSQPVYQENPARDGRLVIISVREGGNVHEVWYLNVHNSLTEYLASIGPEPQVAMSDDEKLSQLQDLLEEQKRLSDRSEDKPEKPHQN